jgi:membrane protein implicated in regulation of membrane protease activity
LNDPAEGEAATVADVILVVVFGAACIAGLRIHDGNVRFVSALVAVGSGLALLALYAYRWMRRRNGGNSVGRHS